MESDLEPSELEKQQKEIRKKYKEFGNKTANSRLAHSLEWSAELEYKSSSLLGWGGVYMVDRFQSMLTGRAITTNTQKVLDAEVLNQENTFNP